MKKYKDEKGIGWKNHMPEEKINQMRKRGSNPLCLNGGLTSSGSKIIPLAEKIVKSHTYFFVEGIKVEDIKETLKNIKEELKEKSEIRRVRIKGRFVDENYAIKIEDFEKIFKKHLGDMK